MGVEWSNGGDAGQGDGRTQLGKRPYDDVDDSPGRIWRPVEIVEVREPDYRRDYGDNTRRADSYHNIFLSFGHIEFWWNIRVSTPGMLSNAATPGYYILLNRTQGKVKMTRSVARLKEASQ